MTRSIPKIYNVVIWLFNARSNNRITLFQWSTLEILQTINNFATTCQLAVISKLGLTC